MPARFPYLRVHDDRAIHAHHLNLFAVWARRRVADHVVPPGVLNVLFQLDAERAVVPEAVDAAVDFARLKDEAAAFAQGDEFVHVHVDLLRMKAEGGRMKTAGSSFLLPPSSFLLLPAALDDAHGADFEAQRVAAQLRNQVELVHLSGGADVVFEAQREKVLPAAADLERSGQHAAMVLVAIPGE